MEISELVFGGLLVAVLVGLAGFYGWRQVRALRALPDAESLPADDRRFEVAKCSRRLVCCGLMFVLGLMLAGSLTFLEGPAERLAAEREAARAADRDAGLDPVQRDFARLYGKYWLVMLVLLFIIVGLAAFDLLAIRRYGLRHYRKIQADRRAMIERQVSRLRHERNGDA